MQPVWQISKKEWIGWMRLFDLCTPKKAQFLLGSDS
jgi:hypothetical protein